MAGAAGRVTLWGVEVFVAVARDGSISAAAQRLGASPSAISQQLTSLETAVGTPLMQRNTRPIQLTPAGEMFRRRAQTILNEAELARAELAQGGMVALTRVRLGMIEDFEADVTPLFLTHLAAELTQCQFLLETGASHALFDQLDNRALDVIVAADMGAPADWMEVHPLMTEGFVVATARGAVAGADDLLTALKPVPFIQYTARHHMGQQIAAHLARQNLTLDHRFELDSYHAILSLVASGAGWTILTPLALMRAQRFRDALDVYDLPLKPLSRTISLTARQGALGEQPAALAGALKTLLDDTIVTPAVERLPWMANRLQVL